MRGVQEFRSRGASEYPGEDLQALPVMRSRRICCEWAPHDRQRLQVLSRILEDAGAGEFLNAAHDLSAAADTSGGIAITKLRKASLLRQQ